MIDWLVCGFVKGLGALLGRMPPASAVWLGERLGDLAYWLQPRRTKIGALNLRAAFDGRLGPAQIRQTLRACYRQFGATLVELLYLPRIDRAYVERYITIEGQAHFDGALASGRPVIFLTGHYGNWELSSIVAALHGHPIVALARAQKRFPRLYRLLVSYRESKGCTIVHKGGAMKRFIAALAERRLVGIVGDQASRQGLLVMFFGRAARFATGPFELAQSRGALVLPAFIRRVRGPFHRLVIEPPIPLSTGGPKPEALRGAIEEFARVLSRHIEADPSQWLWMHKRWKFTPARRVLVLSDGKVGHLKQSLAVVEALHACLSPSGDGRQGHGRDITHEVIPIRYRAGWARLAALVWSWWAPGAAAVPACLRALLTRESAEALLTRYADVIVSCGSSLAPVNLLWSREHGAKSVVVMNPAPLPLRRFHAVIAPRHDGLSGRRNVVQTAGALCVPLPEEQLVQARDQLRNHPRFRGEPPSRGAVIAVFIGGETMDYALNGAFAEGLIAQITAACEALRGWCLVTTSRRTAAGTAQLISERLQAYPRCCLLLLANRDLLDGTMEGMLGLADVAVVTGESISMVSEACASGRRVVVVTPPPRRPGRAHSTKHERFLQELARSGYLRIAPLSETGQAIQRVLTERAPTKRLEDFLAVRDAMARLL